jgi:(S)-sulfolactate dehydrogenase
LLLRRPAYAASAAVAAGEWPRAALAEGRELSGSTLGVVGFGSIGRLVAEIAHRLGMQVIGFDAAIALDSAAWAEHRTAPRPLDDLLHESDVVSLHLPLTEDTRRLLDARRLSLMKRDAILINTSRGGIVDETALAASLRGGMLGGRGARCFRARAAAGGQRACRVSAFVADAAHRRRHARIERPRFRHGRPGGCLRTDAARRQV